MKAYEEAHHCVACGVWVGQYELYHFEDDERVPCERVIREWPQCGDCGHRHEPDWNVGYSGGETRSRVADPDPIDGICLQCYYRDPRHKPLEGPLLKRLRIMAPGDLR